MSESTISESTNRLPRLNEPAPEFDVETTHGRKTLRDYGGRWLLLFSHPADFTPVCTTEFIEFSKAWPEFQKLGCDLLGLSIDSTFSHLAWVRNIKDNFDVTVPFPIIEDLSKSVSTSYGMVMPRASSTSAVRAVFLIDPRGILRAMVYYPMTNGRNVDEFIRLVTALQATDAHQIATPANWQPGDKVIVPPPNTIEEANARMEAGSDCVDWYFCEKELPARERSEKLQDA